MNQVSFSLSELVFSSICYNDGKLTDIGTGGLSQKLLLAFVCLMGFNPLRFTRAHKIFEKEALLKEIFASFE
jgi:hypothetical protein